MKTIKNFFLVAAVACLMQFFSYGNESDHCSVRIMNLKNDKDTDKAVPVPFKADFTGNYTYVGPDTLQIPKCEFPLNAWRAIVDGKGTSTLLGNFTVHFDFCGDSVSHYGNVNAWMISADGDTLFIFCEGQVVDGRLNDHPSYVTSYWRDPFKILGGTGKFKGATGEGMTDDYNSSQDTNSHHSWKGTITLVKEKK